MACPTFKAGCEPLILGTGEAYPQNTYSQQEFLQALLEVSKAGAQTFSVLFWKFFALQQHAWLS
jgi:hypothetical protein